MKKKILTILVGLTLVIVSIYGYIYISSPQTKLMASGTIEATEVDLCAKLSGTIQTIYFQAGDPVKKGQLIAELSRNDLVAQKERDELTVLKAEAALNDLLSGARNQEINEVEANVNIARLQLAKAQDDYERAKVLKEAGALSQNELEQAQLAYEIAQNKLTASEAKLNLVQSGNRPELINAAQAEVERSKAILKATQVLLEDVKIFAPLDGVVLTKNFEEGEFVQAGSSIMKIANLKEQWIKVYVPTDDLPKVYLGQKVHFTVSGLTREFVGIVKEISSKGEFTPKTIQTKKERTNVVFGVKIAIQDSQGVLKPGMPADVVFEVKDK